MSKWLDHDGYPKKKAYRVLHEADEANDWWGGLDLLRAMWNRHYGTVSEKLTETERQLLDADRSIPAGGSVPAPDDRGVVWQ